MIGVVIDQAVTPGDGTALVGTLAGLCALFGVLTVAMRYGGRSNRTAMQWAAHGLRLAIVRRVLDPRDLDPETARAGTLLSTATLDAQRAGMVNSAVWLASGGAAALIVSAVVLLNVSVPLGLLVVLGLVPVFVATQLLARPLSRRSGVEQAAAAQATGIAGDLVSGLRVLKGVGAELTAAARYRAASDRSRHAAVRAAWVAAAQNGLIMALTGGFLALVALVGGGFAAEGRITVGEFVSAIGLTQFLIGPFTRISRSGSVAVRAYASAKRIATVLAAPPAVADGERGLPRTAGGLALRNVAYGPLRDVCLDVRPGELTGVVTTDAAAARALLELLARDADPERGAVELDGIALPELRLDEVRRTVLVAAHDADLFAGTVADNIDAGRGDGFAAAVAAAGADQVAGVLAQGLDTAVTERGRSLSGGQRQRVALARALAAGPPVLVLHDPTTAVDAATEAHVAAGVRAVRDGRTTVMVTTSPALLAVADRVVLIDDGTVAAEGAHADLVRRDARYREVVLS